MRAVLLLAPSLLLAASASAFPPTAGGGSGIAPSAPRGGGIVGQVRREAPSAADPRHFEIAGQLRQFDERIDDLRESGQISRREARDMRREAHAIAPSWWSFGGDGLSDSETDELQDRLLAANSRALPSRASR